MEARIKLNKEGNLGYLEIKRGTDWRTCQCPIGTISGNEKAGGFVCGDWCPLFGDPILYDPPKTDPPGPCVALNLCHTTLYFDKFEDLRDLGVSDSPDKPV